VLDLARSDVHKAAMVARMRVSVAKERGGCAALVEELIEPTQVYHLGVASD